MGIHQTFPTLTTSRADIEAMIELLIARLDEMDGDPDCETCDLEDDFALSWIARGNADGPGCPVSDPGGRWPDEDEAEGHIAIFNVSGAGCPISDGDACLAADDGCHALYDGGKRVWGSRHEELLPMLPRYGINQARGPLNEREAQEHWQRAQWRRA